MPEAPEITEMRKHGDNREYVLKAVNENGKLLDFAAEEFHNDREIVLDAVKNASAFSNIFSLYGFNCCLLSKLLHSLYPININVLSFQTSLFT